MLICTIPGFAVELSLANAINEAKNRPIVLLGPRGSPDILIAEGRRLAAEPDAAVVKIKAEAKAHAINYCLLEKHTCYAQDDLTGTRGS